MKRTRYQVALVAVTALIMASGCSSVMAGGSNSVEGAQRSDSVRHVSGSGPIYDSLAKMGRASSVIVVGKVISSRKDRYVFGSGDGEVIIPMQMIEVMVLRSSGQSVSKVITVGLESTEDKIIVDDAFPELEVNDSYAFFLNPNEKSERESLMNYGTIYFTVGGPETVFRVEDDVATPLEELSGHSKSKVGVARHSVDDILDTLVGER